MAEALPISPEEPTKIDLQQLFKYVTCSIHFGLFKDARSLPCGHVFCTTCLDEYYLSCIAKPGGFLCPLCRKSITITREGIQKFPPNYTINEIVSLLKSFKTKVKSCPKVKSSSQCSEITETSKSSCPKKEENLDKMMVLFKDILNGISKPCESRCSQRRSEAPNLQLESCSSELQTTVCDVICSLQNINRDLCCVENLQNFFASTGELVTVDEIQKRMRKYSQYKVDKQIPLSNYLATDTDSNEYSKTTQAQKMPLAYRPRNHNSETYEGRVISVREADLLLDDVYIGISKSANNSNPNVVIFSGQIVRPFSTYLLQPNFVPIFLQCDYESVYISGWIIEQGTKLYRIIKCNPQGRIMKQSTTYISGDPKYPSLSGFCIDTIQKVLYVTQPELGKVCVLYADTLVDTGRCFLFDGFHPYFVTKPPHSQELWVTCPEEQEIMVVNESNEENKKISTKEKYDLIPGQIIYTTDKRILILDDKESRIFWIRKENDLIVLQRLICTCLKDDCITSIKGSVNDKVTLCQNGKVFVIRPKRPIPASLYACSSSKMHCTVL